MSYQTAHVFLKEEIKIITKQFKNCPPYLVVREKQVKTSCKLHLTPNKND